MRIFPFYQEGGELRVGIGFCCIAVFIREPRTKLGAQPLDISPDDCRKLRQSVDPTAIQQKADYGISKMEKGKVSNMKYYLSSKGTRI